MSASILRREWREMREVLSNFVIVWSEYNWVIGEVTYTAYSEFFDEIPEGTGPTPEYQIVLERVGQKTVLKEVNRYDRNEIPKSSHAA